MTDSGYQYGIPFLFSIGGQSLAWQENLRIFDGYHLFDIKEKTKSYLNCDDEFKSQFHCFASKIFNVNLTNCTEQCIPLQLTGFLNIAKPIQNEICKNISQDICYQTVIGRYETIFNTCLPSCELKSYDVTHSENPEKYGTGTKSTYFAITSSSKVRILNQEYLVYDTIGLIGTVGGSLGLFVGFSFFDLFCTLFDRFMDKLVQYFYQH